MPKLPHAGFTADVSQRQISGQRGPTASAASFGGDIAAGLGQVGAQLGQMANVLQQRKQNEEMRRLKVEAAKTAEAFEAELEEATKSGADFEPIADKYRDTFSRVGEEIATPQGRAAFEQTLLTVGDHMRVSAAKAQAVRAREQARQDTFEFGGILGNRVLQNVDMLPRAQADMDGFIDTFTGLPAEVRSELKREKRNEFAGIAADTLLENDPQRLLKLASTGAISGLTPGERAAYVSKANRRIEALERKAGSKDFFKDLENIKWREQNIENGVITEDMAPLYHERGLSAANLSADMEKSMELAEQRQIEHNNRILVAAGAGGSLKPKEYQTALDQLTADHIEDLPEEERFQAALDFRANTLIKNGKIDSALQRTLNSGVFADAPGFIVAAEFVDRIRSKRPNLAAAMLDEDAAFTYDIYNFLRTTRNDMNPEAVVELAQFASTNQKEVRESLRDKEIREEIADKVESIATIGDAVSNAPYVKQRLTDWAHKFRAFNPSITNEQAIALAEEHFKRTHVEVNGFQVQRKGVPEDHQEADLYIRRIVIQRELKRAGLEPVDDFELRRWRFIPKGDGTAAVQDSETGALIFTKFAWQTARDEWWFERGEPALKKHARLVTENNIKAEKRRRRREEARKEAVETGALF